MQRFIANTPRQLCSSEQALDFQIAQRVLPQVRGLFRPLAREAFERLKNCLEKDGTRFPESLRVLAEVERLEAPGALFGEG
jgi:hypothetical protein